AALFFVQRFGTGGGAAGFRPITPLLVVALGVSWVLHVVEEPGGLSPVHPIHGPPLLLPPPGVAIVVLGAAFLAVTGAEALYVDLGHFGRRPIVVAWFSIVFPCLLLNYFGQGAFILANPEGTYHPFFAVQPEWARLPMVVLATA